MISVIKPFIPELLYITHSLLTEPRSQGEIQRAESHTSIFKRIQKRGIMWWKRQETRTELVDSCTGAERSECDHTHSYSHLNRTLIVVYTHSVLFVLILTSTPGYRLYNNHTDNPERSLRRGRLPSSFRFLPLVASGSFPSHLFPFASSSWI